MSTSEAEADRCKTRIGARGNFATGTVTYIECGRPVPCQRHAIAIQAYRTCEWCDMLYVGRRLAFGPAEADRMRAECQCSTEAP